MTKKKTAKKKVKQNGVKDKVLEYIQNESLALRKKVPGLSDIRFEDDPPRMVLTVATHTSAPSKYIGVVDFPVEIEAADEAKPVIMAAKDKPEIEEKSDSGFSKQADEVYNIKEAVTPQGLKTADVKAEALKAWQKRHPAIKPRGPRGEE